MVKNKKNFIKKQVVKKEAEALEIEEEAYDSMIDNGSSEDSNDDNDETTQVTDDSESDDGFSEKEDEPTAVEVNKKSKDNIKRKPEANVKTTATEPSTKKKKTVEKVKPPTLDEINELKETRNLFHSNLFRLQVKEMLTELKIKDKYTNYITAWLEQFKAFTKSLKSEPEKEDMDKMQWQLKCPIQVPLALEQLCIRKHTKPFQFQFIKPNAEPFLIGAAATHTLLGPKLIADICLPMPAESFQKENYLNLIYDQKRAFYLTYVANKMLKSKLFEGVTVDLLKFNYYANNPLKPILEITPPSTAGSLAAKLIIRIFVAAEEKSFKLNRFVPWNNNIRPSVFGDNEEDSVALTTPNYNAGVLFDLTMQRNQQLLNEVFEGNKNIQAGLVLLKVWLQQRQLNIGFSGFHAHVLAMFIAYLVKQRKLHTNMSSYQVARTVWNQLAHSAWDDCAKGGITLCSTENSSPNQPTMEQFHVHYEVVFVDSSGFYNICSNISLEMYRRVRLEAKLAVDMLNDMKLNSFQLIFMTKCPLYTQFDHILKINKDDIIEQIVEMHVAPADKYNYAGYTYPQLLKVITSLLQKGLGARVSSLLAIEQPTTAWPAKETPLHCPEYLHLGIILNPEHAYEVLDKGPESIAEGAEEFRKFWGEKAQLRRFQDGSITESVVWATSTDALTKKRLVVRSIIFHLLQHHFQLEATDVEYVAGEMDIVYKLTSAFKTEKIYDKFKVSQDTDAEAVSLQVIRSFDDLARKLSGLTELPLEIVSIAGISPVFRYCEPMPILPQGRFINKQIYAMNVQRGVIQLGSSGKWPSELSAMRALKTAFYIQIAKLLRDKHHLHTKVTYGGVLVLKQGYCFVIELAHPKEVSLLKKEKSERGLTQYVDCEASIALEKLHYILPKVSGALHALYQLHPSYGGSVMIAKRWLYSQLIDDGLWPDECTELLIASQYLKTNAQNITCSPQTGFMRFLHLLAYTNWRSELFLINFNNALDENEVSELEHRFNAQRETFPPLCIATAYDQKHYGQLWSSNTKPNVNVLARVTILARQALGIIEPALMSPSEGFIKPSKLFTASNQGYDLVIQLKPDIVPNALAFEFGSPFTALSKPNWRLPLAGTNFLKEAVEKLREAYSDFAAFFYNPCGGKEIGIIWKPLIFGEKEFKVTDVNGCNLSDDIKHIQCKKETLIEDFKFILKDFYLRIGSVDEVLTASRESIKQNQANRYFEMKPTAENDNLVKTIKSGKATKAEQKLVKSKKKLNKLKEKIHKNPTKTEKVPKVVKPKKNVKNVKKIAKNVKKIKGVTKKRKQ